jgi:hypothetical protein
VKEKPVTSKELVILFYRLLRDAFDLPPAEYHKASMGRDCAYMKQHVVSFFAEHGYGMSEVERFIRWFFTSYLPVQKNVKKAPHIGWLPGCLVNYFAETRPSQGKLVPDSRDARHRELVYRNDLEFFGLGFKHDEYAFTKMEYWVGYSWRLSHYSKEEMAEYKARQTGALIDKLGEVDAGVHLYRFQQWEREYEAEREERGTKEWAEYIREAFLRVQAIRRKWDVERVKQHYGLADE